MTLIRLFARSRQTGPAGAGLAGICLCAWLWGRWLGDDGGTLFGALIIFPLAAGGILAVVTDTPFGEIERTASRPLAGLRTVLIGGLLAIAAVGLVVATWGWEIDGASKLVLRNVAAFTGLGLLAALVVGGRLAWVAPVIYGIGSYWLIENANAASWLLPSASPGTNRAAAAAIAVVLVGLTLIALRGARDTSNGVS